MDRGSRLDNTARNGVNPARLRCPRRTGHRAATIEASNGAIGATPSPTTPEERNNPISAVLVSTDLDTSQDFYENKVSLTLVPETIKNLVLGERVHDNLI